MGGEGKIFDVILKKKYMVKKKEMEKKKEHNRTELYELTCLSALQVKV